MTDNRLLLDKSSLDASKAATYRFDIDGLRALAVLLVVIYHVWIGRVSGGVDVFLMLSAFFLTASFARKISGGKPLKPFSYWVHTFKRLLPAAAVTIALILLGSYFVLSESQWTSIWRQGIASVFYFENWDLASAAVDYYAPNGGTVSPFQHFWSLSVQGQVFIIWPVLFLLCAFLVKRFRFSVTATLGTLFGIVFLASFVFSVVTTYTDQSYAYFDTRTRVWEFALGSLVAVYAPYFSAPKWAKAAMSWVGLLALLVCGIVLDVREGFPGYLALWPTLAAAALVLGGTGETRYGPQRILSWAPIRRLGNDAYALYLVHWPILIFALVILDREQAGLIGGLLIIALSIVCAHLLSRFVENPLRRWKWAEAKPMRGIAVIAASVLVVVIPINAWQTAEQNRVDELLSSADTNNPGAAVLELDIDPALLTDELPSATLPLPTMLDSEWVFLGSECSGSAVPSDPEIESRCSELLPENGPISKTILVIGDSHSEQFMGALVPIAQSRNWHLISVLTGGCSFGIEAGRCPEYNSTVLDYAIELGPDAVFTVATAATADSPDEELVPGIRTGVELLTAAGIDVVAVRDNPRFSFDIYECASRAPVEARETCGVDVVDALAPENPALALSNVEGVYFVDLTESICPDGRCSPVVGNIYVFRDDNHLSKSYATTLGFALEQQLAAMPNQRLGIDVSLGSTAVSNDETIEQLSRN